MDKKTLTQQALQIATPGYIFDLDLFRARVKLVREAFGEKVGLCFSIKANPFLLKYLPEEFDKIEVCSPGELSICERIGADLGKIIFSGVNKTKKDVERAIDDGVNVLTVESRLHLQLIHDAAQSRGKTVPVLLRLTAGSQFGMDRADVLDIIANRDSYPHVEIVGIHFFSGTQKRKAAAIIKELDKLLAFFEEVQQQYDFRLQRLEYGTGLAVDYFTADAEESEAARLDAISEKIREVGEKTELTVEMGRFFAAPCGYYVNKVIDTKTCEGIHYAILDGGLNQLKYDGQIQGMQIPNITHIPAKSGEEQLWTLCGSLCTTADVLARNVALTGLEIGDTLVFERTGAYSVSEGMALFLSRELPEINVYSAETDLQQLRPLMDASRFNTPSDMDLFGRAAL
ncbi:MAG: alanine racemase [Oscillospiraceae bacterium]|nr:alanine racemase [Oscillospiraceae bacterium]